MRCLFGSGARPALMVATTLLLGACAVGPDYQAPAAPADSAYDINERTAGDPSTGEGQATGAIAPQAFDAAARVRSDWYRVFGSKRLGGLIAEAVEHSPTLAAGQARIKAAREVVKQNKAALYPQINVGAAYDRQRVTGTQFWINDPTFTNVFNFYEAQATASYDLDLFGRTRREIEAANAALDRQQYRVVDTYVTLINNVVATAVAEAGLNAALETTRALIDSQQNALEIVNQQIAFGAAIDSDATQIRTQLARTRASLEPLKKQKTLAVNRLAVLVGQVPGDFEDPAFTLDELRLPERLPASLPSQLVGQRPDILAAAAAVHAASAEIGVATANLLPDLRISGSYSRQALTPANLTDPANALYTLGAQLAAPIFAGGRLRARRRQAEDLYVAALAAARDNLATVRAQIDNGAADYVALYTAQAQYQGAELDFTEARVTRYRGTADLFRALGGGWSDTDGHALAAATGQAAEAGAGDE